MADPVFELFKDSSEKFWFRLTDENGKVVAISQSYDSKSECIEAIESVRKSAAKAKFIENQDDIVSNQNPL